MAPDQPARASTPHSTQRELAKEDPHVLVTRFAELSIAIALKMGTTPHQVHREALESFGWDETIWAAVIEPDLREALARDGRERCGKPTGPGTCVRKPDHDGTCTHVPNATEEIRKMMADKYRADRTAQPDGYWAGWEDANNHNRAWADEMKALVRRLENERDVVVDALVAIFPEDENRGQVAMSTPQAQAIRKMLHG